MGIAPICWKINVFIHGGKTKFGTKAKSKLWEMILITAWLPDSESSATPLHWTKKKLTANSLFLSHCDYENMNLNWDRAVSAKKHGAEEEKVKALPEISTSLFPLTRIILTFPLAKRISTTETCWQWTKIYIITSGSVIWLYILFYLYLMPSSSKLTKEELRVGAHKVSHSDHTWSKQIKIMGKVLSILKNYFTIRKDSVNSRTHDQFFKPFL